MKIYRISERDGKVFGQLEVDGYLFKRIDYTHFKDVGFNSLVGTIINTMRLSYDLLCHYGETLESRLDRASWIGRTESLKKLGVKI